MQFIGCMIGDYAKTAINTSIFTGKTIGACSMVYGFVTGNVPSFVNYARSFGQVTEAPVEVMISTQKRMFARRGREQRPLRYRTVARDVRLDSRRASQLRRTADAGTVELVTNESKRQIKPQHLPACVVANTAMPSPSPRGHKCSVQESGDIPANKVHRTKSCSVICCDTPKPKVGSSIR